ncbi:MAG: TolC family protein [Hyphomicrobiales bacterium]
MNHKVLLWISLIYFLISSNIYAQTQELSLEEAQQYALQNSHVKKNALRDIEIAKKKINETIAIGLPQITGSISNQNYIDLPTTLFPDFIGPVVFNVNKNYFGLDPQKPYPDMNFIPAQFGAKYNVTGKIGVNQLLFSGSYIVGLMASKTYYKQSVLVSKKTDQELKKQVALAYYTVLATQRNLSIFEKTLTNNERLKYEVNEAYKNGFVEDTEVDQLELIISDLKASVVFTEAQIEVAKSMLKSVMGMPLNEEFTLSDSLELLITNSDYKNLLSDKFDSKLNIDFKIAENQVRLMKLNWKNNKTEYLPTISAFFNAQTNAQRNEFNFFDSDQQWFNSNVFGFQLDWKLWTSGSRKSKIQQTKLEYQKAVESRLQIDENLQIEFANLKSSTEKNLEYYMNKEKSKELASKIYEKTQLKYSEGVASSNDLLNTYNQYLQSEGQLIQAIIGYLESKLKLDLLQSDN